MARYLNPFVDYAFKFIFGRDESKPFLIDFLNVLLHDEPGFSPIVRLDYLDKEKSRRDRKVRGVIYDIFCETSNGKRFTVEMQNQPQAYFFDRIIYYSSKAIVDQGMAGKNWRFEFLPVYCVSFMNFATERYKDQFRVDVALCDMRTKELFSDKLRYIFIQTPLFGKTSPEECTSDFDKWMYNIINMPTMETLAFTDQKELFKELEEMASYANLSNEERMAYDADLKAYRDLAGQLEYAEARGEEKGKREMIFEMARQGLGIDLISSVAKMTVDKVRQILSAK